MRAARYSLQEAFRSLRRAGRSTLMSVGTVAVAFLTLGGFLLAAANVQRVVEQWASAAEMSVFLRDGIDETTRAGLMKDLSAHRAVAHVEYVTKEQARDRFRADFPELADLSDGGGENPFPASLELQLRTDPESTGAADALAPQVAERPGVADVRYDRQWLARLMTLVTGIRVTGLAVAGVLILGAAFTVAAVVRLSLFARRDEIEIMRLVGAPFAFIRGPSVAEGTIIGGLGAALALVVLFAIYQTFKNRMAEALVAATGTAHLAFLGAGEMTALVAAALAIGGLTGIMIARAIR